uniref:rRNA methyltransferase 2, mitochondrial n=1 Tax=Strongyloides stercoralis TaxID=6248 RepID=A0A0K0EPP0_STRER
MVVDRLDNVAPKVYDVKERGYTKILQNLALSDDEPITAEEVFEYIRDINDPEHPYTLEQLNVVQEELITVDNDEDNPYVDDYVLELNWKGPFLQMTFLSLVRYATIRTRNGKVKEYLKNQINDEFARKAREHSYRARSVFKLMEINNKYKLFKEGDVVVDVGCAPGSWCQYIVKEVKPNLDKGFVLGIDLKLISPLKGVTFLGQSDITDEKTHNEIKKLIGDRKVNAVVSDMAPNPCGDKKTDQIRLVNMCKEVIFLFTKYKVLSLDRKGIFLCKIWEGDSRKELMEVCKTYFDTVNTIKPKASKDDSAELYILGRGFKSNL